MDSINELYHLPGFFEPFNALSHLVAALLFAVLGWTLILRGASTWLRALWLSIYAVACVLLFSMSAVLHMLPEGGAAVNVFNRLDHAAIFVLIAGTFTAVHGLVARGWARWIPMGIVWGITAACITLKTVFFADLPDWLGVALYIAMGWGVALAVIPIVRRSGWGYITPLLVGGVSYSLGAIMEHLGWFTIIPGVVHAHEIWHVMVLIGALSHWRFVWKIAGDAAYLETPAARRMVPAALPRRNLPAGA
jgi:channel protein (hemolysin III family)